MRGWAMEVASQPSRKYSVLDSSRTCFISGDTSRVQALRPGTVMIQKPFLEPDLVRAIQRALGAAAAC
jgi:hypothetical protein